MNKRENPSSAHRLVKGRFSLLIRFLLALSLLLPVYSQFVPLARAQQPETAPAAALPPCSPAMIVSAAHTQIANPTPALSPGPLFSDSGSFEEKPVDTPCDPGKQIGTFPVDAAGKLVVRLTGNPPAPSQWSLHNHGTSVNIVYEPLLGNEYGPGQNILSLALPAEKTEIEGGGEWPGPGRLTASTGAPWGAGPLTSSCFGQSYSVQADIVEVFPNIPAAPGTTLLDGAQIVTEPGVGYAHLALMAGGVYAGSALAGPDTDLTLVTGSASVDPALVAQAGQPLATSRTCGKAASVQPAAPAQAGDPEWKAALKRQALEWYRAGLPEPEGFWENPNKYWDDFSASEWELLRAAAQGNSDPLAAAVELKLTAEAYRGWGVNARERNRLQTFQKSRQWTEEQIAERKKQIQQEVGRLWQEFSAQYKNDLDSPQAYAAAQGVQRQANEIGQEILDLEQYRLPVLRGDGAGITWDEKQRHPSMRELQRQVYEWAEAGMPMPDGYRDDPTRFWADYGYDTIADALEEIREEPNPCEGLLRFKMFMEANQGEWTSRNWGGKTADLTADLALIWLPPNAFDTVKTLLKDALLVTTPVGQAAVTASKVASAVKNSKATYDRLLKEISLSANDLRAKRMYAEVRATQGWDPQQVTARMQDYQQQMATLGKAMRARSEKFNLEYAQLLDRVRPLETWGNYIITSVFPTELRALKIEMERLKNSYEEDVRQLADQTLELQTYHAALETYRLPVAQGGCEALRAKEKPQPSSRWLCAGDKTLQLALKKGLVRISKSRLGPYGQFLAEVIVSAYDESGPPQTILVKPDGTDYSVEKRDGAVTVRVFDGAVKVTAPDGLPLTVNAGQQVTLPEGTISDFDLAVDSQPHTTSLPGAQAGLVSGLRLRDVPVDSSVLEPYGDYTLTSEEGELAPGWIWQETDDGHHAIQNAILEITGPDAARVTAAHPNIFGGYQSDGPRLIHKATGDFEVEVDMLLECEGRHYASSDFILFTPGIPLGYLKAGMRPEGLGAQYYPIYSSGRSFWDNQSKLGVINRPNAELPEAPGDTTPLRVRLSRRGDVIKSYWSTDGGATWTLSTRQTLPLPETLWAGWVFQRNAQDGLGDKPAVTTLSGARLHTAPLNTLPDDGWDVIDGIGASIVLETEMGLAHDGVAPGDTQVYSPWAIPGDFDLTVRYTAPPIEAQPGEERWIYAGVSSSDGKDRAYIADVMRDGKHFFAGDMSINGGWYRWQEAATEEHTGLVRLVRRGGKLTSHYRRDNDWVMLNEWKDDFAAPLYLDFRYSWKTPNPSLQGAQFAIERLSTPDGLWIGPPEEIPSPAAGPSPAAQGSGFLGGDATPPPQSEPLIQPTAQSEPLVQPELTLALPLPAEQPGIAEFTATPAEVTPGQWVTLSWRTSGGRPYLYRVGADGQAKPESSDILKPVDSMEIPVQADPGSEVTWALGVLSEEKNEWIETKTLKVKVSLPPPPPLPLPTLPPDPYQPPSLPPESPPQAKLGPFTFSSDFDEAAAQPINVGQTFPAGTPKVWASWLYSDFPAGTLFQYEWYRNGKLFGQGEYQFWQSSGASWTWVTGEGGSSLPSGTYTFVLYISGQRYEIGSVLIQ